MPTYCLFSLKSRKLLNLRKNSHIDAATRQFPDPTPLAHTLELLVEPGIATELDQFHLDSKLGYADC